MATPPDELTLAISRHNEAVGALSQALGRYRNGSNGGADEDEAESEVRLAAEQLDAATDQYEQTSLVLSGIIIEHLVDDRRGDDAITWLNSDAVTRLAAMIAIDAKVAEQAALLAEIREPQASEREYLTRQLTSAELDDLGPELTTASEPMFEELRQGNEAGTPAPQESGASEAAGQRVEQYVHEILDRAGDDIVGTITASVSWQHRVAAVIKDLIDNAGGWPADALAHLASGLSALRRLLARAWRLVLLKVGVLVGQRAADVGAAIADQLDLLHEAAKHGAGWALGKLLKIDGVTAEAKVLLKQNPNHAEAAIRACRDVDHHHERRRWGVPLLNKALPACAVIHFGGLALEAIAAAALLIYSMWLAHDHLDSPVAASVRLPRNPGLLTSVRAAAG